VRDSLVESLSRTLSWGRMLRGLVPPVREFLAQSGAREVLDLCSGAGGPASILADEIADTGA
jgi:methylase of polypeptide subunit release factors